jgi:cyclopropane-fatty-acyl-phospholipid synthase
LPSSTNKHFNPSVATTPTLTSPAPPPSAKQPSLLIETFEDRFLFGRLPLPQSSQISGTDKLDLNAMSTKSKADESAVSAQLRVRDLDFFVRVVSRADVGFAEAYVAGEFDTPDLLGLLKYMIHLRDSTAARLKQRSSLADDAALVATTAALGTLSTIGRMASSLYHWSRRNSTANTRANIGAHYDLGNDFFRLFLDPRDHGLLVRRLRRAT